MRVQRFTVGMFQVNTWLLTDEATGAAAIVDTGEDASLLQRLTALDPVPDIQLILLTHAHIDHAGSLPLLQERWDVPTVMPKLERPLFETLPMQGSMFGMPQLNRPCGRIDREIEDGETVQFGETTLKFLSTPGHTPGQGCYYDHEHIIVGDTKYWFDDRVEARHTLDVAKGVIDKIADGDTDLSRLDTSRLPWTEIPNTGFVSILDLVSSGRK